MTEPLTVTFTSREERSTVVLVLLSAWTARQIYPSQKWWMRAGYVWLWNTSNWLRGDDMPLPDRFK